jgi:hypothetical protein
MQLRIGWMIALLWVADIASAQVNTWNGATGSWHTAANWSLGLPVNGQRVRIQGSGAVCTINNLSAFSGGIEVESGATLQMLGTNAALTINSNTTHDGIEVKAGAVFTIASGGLVQILQTGGAGTEGQGILNFGTITNTGDIIIGGTIDESGIWNRAGATFTNNHIIEFQNVDFRGIDNLGGTFYNNGIIRNVASMGNSFIATGNNSTFVNAPCSLLESYKANYDAADLENNGLLIDDSATASTIGENNGVTIKIGGGTLTNLINNGHAGTSTNYAVWMGCKGTAANDVSNWAKIGDLPDSDDTVIIPTAPQGGNVFPVFNNVNLSITNTGSLLIEEDAMMEVMNAPGIALQNAGVMEMPSFRYILSISYMIIFQMAATQYN